MRKDLGAKPFCYPMPVYIIATYNSDGSSNAMVAAWGGISEETEITVCISPEHRTTENILSRKAFTVSMATLPYTAACDYLGLVSGKEQPDKLEKAGLHPTPSDKVDAPLLQELPMALECTLLSYDPESCRLVGRIVNVSVEEAILSKRGTVDPQKLQPIIFDPVNSRYWSLGERAGNALRDGLSFMAILDKKDPVC